MCDIDYLIEPAYEVLLANHHVGADAVAKEVVGAYRDAHQVDIRWGGVKPTSVGVAVGPREDIRGMERAHEPVVVAGNKPLPFKWVEVVSTEPGTGMDLVENIVNMARYGTRLES